MENNATKRIAAISDLSGLGKCSLTVALPVISASGVECSCMPTALLSTHTGEFTGWTLHDLSGEMLPIARHWRETGADFDGIYSGYLASPGQVSILSDVIELLAGRDTIIIVDPAMADNGEYYTNFDDRMRDAFRRLCARANIITPNITEAALLAGVPYEHRPHDAAYIDRLFDGLFKLGAKTVAITGLHRTRDDIGIIVRENATGSEFVSERRAYGGMFYGTGDLFASAFSALLVRGAGLGDALEAASWLVEKSIERSFERGAPRRFGVDFEQALPGYIDRVQAMFK